MSPGDSSDPHSIIRGPQSGRPARILIADDDPGTRELLASLVQDFDYEAEAVPDGEAVRAVVTARPPDLLPSDVNMPGLNGLDLCRRLKDGRTTRLIPAVLITGIGEEFKLQGIEAGADEFLGKPFSTGELRARVLALLPLRAFSDEPESAEPGLYTLGKSIEAEDPYTNGRCERPARAERPDLILMGLHLPAMTGYEATRILRADPASAAIPVVALTAQAMPGEEAKAREAGCDAYLTKPVDTRALCGTLRRFLGGRLPGSTPGG